MADKYNHLKQLLISSLPTFGLKQKLVRDSRK